MKGVIFLVVAAVVILPLIGGIVVWQRRQAASRREAIKSMAARLRAEFRPDGSPELHQSLAALPLFSRGSRRRLYNLMQRFADDPALRVFDYEYYQSSGQSGHFVRQTVACVDLERRALPEFSLRPESVLDRIATKFGGQDIDFEQHPGFSAKYRLQSPREDEVRRLFTRPVMDWFERQVKCHVECTGRRIIWYQGGQLVPPEQLGQFTRDAMDVLGRLVAT
jgi:hypothetical protein